MSSPHLWSRAGLSVDGLDADDRDALRASLHRIIDDLA